jgi:ATP-dependent Clp protease ATP-binding subunit ClpC
VEDPLSEEILRGNFKGKDLIRITVTGEGESKHLFFESLSTGKAEGEKAPLAQAGSDAT